MGAGIGVTTVNVDNAATIAPGANITAGSVDVSASSQRTFSSIGLAATAVGVAAAAMTVEDSTTTTAQVDALSVSARAGVNVDAQNLITATVLTTSVAAGTAGGLDLLALTPSTTATIGADFRVSSGTGAAGGDVTVDADSTITLPTLPFSGANAAVIGGVGAGVTIAVLTPTTDASIGDGADVTAGAAQGGSQPSLGSVTVDATSAETLFTEGAGLSIGGYAGGALTVYVLTGGATAEIGAATVTATGNVAAQASNSVSGDILVGGFAAGGVSGGGALGVSVIDTTTSASIDANANVTAYALRSSGVGYVESYDGTFTPYVAGSSILPASLPNMGSSSADPEDPLTTGDVTSAGEDLLLEERNSSPVNANASGVIVTAANADTIRTISVSGALGGAAIALSADAPIVISTTKATIGASASINKQTAFTAGADQSVVVAAANDFYSLGVADPQRAASRRASERASSRRRSRRRRRRPSAPARRSRPPTMSASAPKVERISRPWLRPPVWAALWRSPADLRPSFERHDHGADRSERQCRRRQRRQRDRGRRDARRDGRGRAGGGSRRRRRRQRLGRGRQQGHGSDNRRATPR